MTRALRCDVRVVSCVWSRVVGVVDALSLIMTLHYVTCDVSTVRGTVLRRLRACSVTRALRSDVRVVSRVWSRVVGVVEPLSLIITLQYVRLRVSTVRGSVARRLKGVQCDEGVEKRCESGVMGVVTCGWCSRPAVAYHDAALRPHAMSVLWWYSGGEPEGVQCDEGVKKRCESGVMRECSRVVGVADALSLVMALHCVHRRCQCTLVVLWCGVRGRAV